MDVEKLHKEWDGIICIGILTLGLWGIFGKKGIFIGIIIFAILGFVGWLSKYGQIKEEE